MKRVLVYNAGVFILLVVVSCLVYLNSLNNGFYFDDFQYIVENQYIRSLQNIPRFFIDIDTLSSVGSWHYRPLVLVSHAVNYSIGRLNPAGYHILSLAFHIGTAYLLFLILKTMLGGGFIPLASALIFAVHPFNSEVVNYITARSSVMSGFFYLLSFYCWVKFRSHSRRDRVDRPVGLSAAGDGQTLRSVPTGILDRPLDAGTDVDVGTDLQVCPQSMDRPEGLSLQMSLRDVASYIASLLAFLLGMLSKELVITLPAVLFLYDLYFTPVKGVTLYERLKWQLKMSAPIIPFILMVAIPYVIVRLHFLGRGILSPPKGYFLHFLMETKVIVKYLSLLFSPSGLSVDHLILPAGSILEIGVILPVAVLVFVIAAAFLLCRFRDIEWRLASFFIFWFFIALLPVTLVVLQAPLQENRGYIAGAGFAVFLGTALNRLCQWSKREAALKILILILVMIFYTVMTIGRNEIWADEFTLWKDAANKYPMSWRAHYSLGKVYYDQQMEDLAFKEFIKAVELKPGYFDALYALGLIHKKRGELEQARLVFEKAIRVEPYWMKTHMNLGEVYEKLGEMELALRKFQIVVKLGERLREEDRMVFRAREHIRWIRGQK